jgi:hypothetical protein
MSGIAHLHDGPNLHWRALEGYRVSAAHFSLLVFAQSDDCTVPPNRTLVYT